MKNLFKIKKANTVSDKYSKKVSVPQYLPSNKKPIIDELFNYSKYSKLIWNIEHASITEEERKFLKFAATRHIIFNYAKIADYYAHATPEMQRLMEESALVILDIDDAIANGYVKLSKTITQIMEDSGESTKNAN